MALSVVSCWLLVVGCGWWVVGGGLWVVGLAGAGAGDVGVKGWRSWMREGVLSISAGRLSGFWCRPAEVATGAAAWGAATRLGVLLRRISGGDRRRRV